MREASVGRWASAMPVAPPRAQHGAHRQLLGQRRRRGLRRQPKERLIKKQIYKSRELAKAAITD
jgi:hypothetical protein